MARKPRIEFSGAFYHVMCRGNRKEPIFSDSSDRERLMRKIGEYKRTYGFILYAFTLMRNHFHFLIETRAHPLSRIMQGLVQSYTQGFNRKYRTVGHVFQGRYKAIVCDRDAYLLNLVRYIHLNPVRAGIVQDPAEYRWSSHRIYLGLESSSLVDTSFVLSQFGTSVRKSVLAYKAFVAEWIDKESIDDFYSVTDQRFLGDEEFIEKAKHKTGEASAREDAVRKNRSLEEIASKVMDITGIPSDDLCGRSRNKDIVNARSLFVRLCLMHTEFKRKDIAKYLDRVPRIIPYFERRLNDDTFRALESTIKW